jgi:ribosomal protein S18 acetylase RimI-like enzyme
VELDLLGARAWPALEEERLGGWRLRFSRGITGRANSVLPLGPDDGPPLGQRIDAVEAAYRAHGLPPKFQLVPSAWPPELSAALAARGYVEDEGTLVMTAPIGEATGEATLRTEVTDVWLDLYGHRDARGIVERIEPETRFAERDGVACGLGVLDGDWLGVYCMRTRTGARRQGHAREIVGALLAWGRSAGASRAYLCVHSTNETAQALYRGFGFETAQTYRYFTAAG